MLTQTVPPCKPSLCPLTDPEQKGRCQIKRDMETANRSLEVCPVQLVVNEATRAKLLKAIESGDPTQAQDLIATLMAGMHELAGSQLAEVMREGLSVDVDVFGSDGERVGSTVKVNPRAEPMLKLLEMVGATAAQQAITPKASGERKRDEGIGKALDFYKRRRELAAATFGGPPGD